MANYVDLDESQLTQLLSEADSYEERSLIRQALRQKKKERGASVGRSKGGAASYNRFAGSSRSNAPTPKNYIAVKSNTDQTHHKAPQATQSPEPIPDDQQSPEPISDFRQSPEPIPDVRQSPEPIPDVQQSPEPIPDVRQSPEPIPDVRHSPESIPDVQHSPEPIPDVQQSPDAVDGDVDPGLGEEDGTSECVTVESPSEPVETNDVIPEHKDRLIEEPDGHQAKAKHQKPAADFGVQLRKTKPAAEKSIPSSAPRTLRDYQKLTQSKTSSDQGPMEGDDLQRYLVAYVNKELSLNPPLPVKGRALFEAASDPTNLCKLINKSVPNTVDLRALTKISVRASEQAKKEALEENMTLAVESARAVGCRVTDSLGDKILAGDPQTIHKFLVDLIRARVVHMPGMDEEPSDTFTSISALFSKLNIPVDSVEYCDTPSSSADTTPHTYEERAALRKAEREKKKSAEDDGRQLTYEERAAQRKLEREKRRREREALAK